VVLVITFSNRSELLKRVQPALTTRENDFRRRNIYFINKDNILTSLINKKWINDVDLTLSEIVDDILYCNADFVYDYYRDR